MVKFNLGNTIIIGNAPSVEKFNDIDTNTFDTIIRLNNYKLAYNFDNYSVLGTRCDIWYSYFGKAISKTANEAISNGVKMVYMRYPNVDFIKETGGKYIRGVNDDFLCFNNTRKVFFSKFLIQYIQSYINFSHFYKQSNNTMLTTGTNCIHDMLYNPIFSFDLLYITGFDFFSSGISNYNEQWNEKNGKGHNFFMDKNLITLMLNENKQKNIVIDNTLKDYIYG